MELQTLFWNAPFNSIADGYIYNQQSRKYTCLICGESFDKDIIYPVEDQFYNGLKKVKHHIHHDHNGMFDYMVNLNKSYTSLSENQKQVLELMYEDLPDQEIAKKLGLSASTIRNYRFKFNEKEKQAKIFLAMMDALHKKKQSQESITDTNTEKSAKGSLVAPHLSATTLDDRYDISQEERLKTLERYFDETGKLLSLPSKQKRKIIVLTEIVKNFKLGNTYTEKEINRILQRISDDHVHVRRYLIEYGFFDRSKDGSSYWRLS